MSLVISIYSKTYTINLIVDIYKMHGDRNRYHTALKLYIINVRVFILFYSLKQHASFSPQNQAPKIGVDTIKKGNCLFFFTGKEA